MKNNRVLPAEWHRQSGVQLTWPHLKTDWAYMLDEVDDCFVRIAREIARREILMIVTPDPERVKALLHGLVDMDRLRFFRCETNDTWARDHGAITLLDGSLPVMLDFKFNGWGLKFASNFDNLITGELFRGGMFDGDYENRLNFVLEGGSVESDGAGTLLTTSECLLSPNRNGEWDRLQVENYLKACLNLHSILWLDYGYLAGDDTDSHVDTLARLCPDNTIAYVRCDDVNDEHYKALRAMEEQLAAFRTPEGRPYRLMPLPMADEIIVDGERLPATYANFLVINGAVLLPTYNQPLHDGRAAEVLQQCFPDREIVGIDCRVLIRQHGSLHCVTMQYPEGVIL